MGAAADGSHPPLITYQSSVINRQRMTRASSATRGTQRRRQRASSDGGIPSNHVLLYSTYHFIMYILFSYENYEMIERWTKFMTRIEIYRLIKDDQAHLIWLFRGTSSWSDFARVMIDSIESCFTVFHVPFHNIHPFKLWKLWNEWEMNKVHDSNWNLSTNQRRKQRRRQRASSDGGGRNQTKSFSFFFFLLIFSLFFHSQQKKGEIPLSLSRHGCYRVIFFFAFFPQKKRNRVFALGGTQSR